jgi:hypothetical protein
MEIVILLAILTSPLWLGLIALKLYAVVRGTNIPGLARRQEVKRREEAIRRGRVDGQLNREALTRFWNQ